MRLRQLLKKELWAALLILLLVGCGVEAVPFTWTAPFVEPVTNADGTPLADLAHLNFYCSVNGAPTAKGPDITASSPTGGARFDPSCTVELLPGAENTIDYWATATDTSGNESADSPHRAEIKDFLAPAPPEMS